MEGQYDIRNGDPARLERDNRTTGGAYDPRAIDYDRRTIGVNATPGPVRGLDNVPTRNNMLIRLEQLEMNLKQLQEFVGQIAQELAKLHQDVGL